MSTSIAPAPVEYVPRPGPTTDLPWKSAALAGVLELLLLFHVELPVVTWLGGLWLVLVLPAQLLFAKVDWRASTPFAAFCYSVASTVLGAMVLGLVINTVLPWVGIAGPLGQASVTVTSSLALAGLFAWRPARWRWSIRLAGPVRFGTTDLLVVTGSVMVVGAAVIGAVRLNNGGGGSVTVLMLSGAAAVLVAMLALQSRLEKATLGIGVYCVSLALLLMTSVRGWYTTGHDIQREYKLFELTRTLSHWDISHFRDPYNACLSITILPTVISRMTHIPDVAVYKLPYQLLFALCPVIVFQLANRFGTRTVALLSVVFFVSFPTYFTDMPFLNRQEIAFLFLGCALLVLTEPRWPSRRRTVTFVVFGVGMVFSHYSTTYVFLATLIVLWLASHVLRWLTRARLARSVRWVARGRSPVGIVSILSLVAVTFVWSGPLTHTNGQLEKTVGDTVFTLVGLSQQTQQSSDASYNLFSVSRPDPESRLHAYAAQTSSFTPETRAVDGLYPRALVSRYSTPITPQVQMPLTALGRAIDGAGIPVASFNSALRQGSAKLLQLLVLIGLALTALRRARGFRPSPAIFLFATASFVVVSTQVFLPVLSVDYGLLRAFQQALFVLAPFIAVATVSGFRWARVRRPVVPATALALVLFLSLTGVIPQLLGGYPPQLQLNDAGQYYDLYYLHAQEVAGIDWLQGVAGTSASGVQSEVETDRYTFSRIQSFSGIRVANDIYPTLVRKGAYVFLGYSTVTKDKATVSFDGDLLTYKYPVQFLDANKDLIYASNGTRIYK